MNEVNIEDLEQVHEEMLTPDQADAAIAEALGAQVNPRAKQADLPETDSSEEDTDEDERRPF